MTWRLPIICDSCKHFHRDVMTPTTCDAFPEQIPWEILAGMSDHMVSTGNDKGIIYELDPMRQEALDIFYDFTLTDEADEFKTLALEEIERRAK